jgi:tRNA (guanine26-N2/guanine27-N2)-dimethyltransferase
MAADRDLGVAFVRAWAAELPAYRSGWEVASATGVRGLRLLLETGAFDTFRFTESNPAAFSVLERNVAGTAGARAVLGDGRVAPAEGPFDYVDIDPFGSPIPFVATALRAVRPGGVLAVTATDMIVLAGAQASATWRRYGGRPVRGRLGPEGGLRILLAYLAREARGADRSIRPLLAYARDHHVRAYVEVVASPGPPDPVGTIDPDRWDGPWLGAPGPFGPLWLGPISDRALLARMEVPPTAERRAEVRKFLERLREESEVPAPFYYESNVLAGRLTLRSPPPVEALRAAIVDRGYRASRTHARPEGIRTDAPRSVVEAIARTLDSAGQSQNARVRA